MSTTLHPQAQAFGKVILFGDHAVVYGCPALAVGLPGGLSLAAEPLADAHAPTELSIPDWDLAFRLDDADHPVARACRAVFTHCQGPTTGFRIRGTSPLPCAAGLGSSAALTVAIARLVLGPDAEDDAVVAASLAGERVFHGEPSGIDSQVAARGGVLRFVRGNRPRAIASGQLEASSHGGATLPLVVCDSGRPRQTHVEVAKVRARFERFPGLRDPILACFRAVVDAAQVALDAHDLATLGELMNVNHELLSTLGVSCVELDRLTAEARTRGALGAKLTGAGGGGCIVALTANDPEVLAAALRDAGERAFAVEVPLS